MNMFVSSENSAVAITLNSEKETLVPVGSFFDKMSIPREIEHLDRSD